MVQRWTYRYDLPGHGILQSVFCTGKPGHWLPPFKGAGLVQVLVFLLCPRPHLTLHSDHVDQVLQPPLTVKLNVRFRFSVRLVILFYLQGGIKSWRQYFLIFWTNFTPSCTVAVNCTYKVFNWAPNVRTRGTTANVVYSSLNIISFTGHNSSRCTVRWPIGNKLFGVRRCWRRCLYMIN